MGTMRPSSACWLWQGRHQSVSPALQEDGGREEEDKVLPVLQVVNEALGEGLDLVHQGPIGLQPQGHTLGGVQHKEQVHRAVWARDRRRGSALRSPFPRGAPPAALATSPASHPLIPSQAPTLLKEQGDVSPESPARPCPAFLPLLLWTAWLRKNDCCSVRVFLSSEALDMHPHGWRLQLKIRCSLYPIKKRCSPTH